MLQSCRRNANKDERRMNTIEEYLEVIEEFKNDNPELQIYMAGEISHPGISDLDFLVLDKKPIINPRVERSLCGGNVLVYPSKFFNKINFIEKFNLKLIQGKELQTIDPPEEYFQIIEILEWLPERILLLENIEDYHDKIKILLYLKSINRSIEKVEKLNGCFFERKSIDELRKNYNNYDFRDIIQVYLRIAKKCWHLFESDNNLFKGKAKGYVNLSTHYAFGNKFEMLLLYFHSVINFGTSLSKELATMVKVRCMDYDIDKEFLYFIHERWELLSEIYDWHKENKINKGMIKYGWFL